MKNLRGKSLWRTSYPLNYHPYFLLAGLSQYPSTVPVRAQADLPRGTEHPQRTKSAAGQFSLLPLRTWAIGIAGWRIPGVVSILSTNLPWPRGCDWGKEMEPALTSGENKNNLIWNGSKGMHAVYSWKLYAWVRFSLWNVELKTYHHLWR